MPRLYSQCGDPYDFCHRCFPPESEVEPGGEYWDGPGPDGRDDASGHDCPHPDYDPEDYHCDDCGVKLTDRNG
jgi:hypothetical protein